MCVGSLLYSSRRRLEVSARTPAVEISKYGQCGSLRYETNAALHEERNTRAQVKLQSTTWKIFLAVDDVEVVGYLGS